MEEIDMDKLIKQMFPLGLLDQICHLDDCDWLAEMIYAAYAQGFKDGYAKRNPDSVLKLTFVDKRPGFLKNEGEDNA